MPTVKMVRLLLSAPSLGCPLLFSYRHWHSLAVHHETLRRGVQNIYISLFCSKLQN